jgi:hypothetical protein
MGFLCGCCVNKVKRVYRILRGTFILIIEVHYKKKLMSTQVNNFLLGTIAKPGS